MQWIEERHSGQKGYRSECGTWYLGASPKKYYGVWQRVDSENNLWRQVAGGYDNVNAAKLAVEERAA